MVRDSFLKDCQFAFLKFHSGSFGIVCGSEFSILAFPLSLGSGHYSKGLCILSNYSL